MMVRQMGPGAKLRNRAILWGVLEILLSHQRFEPFEPVIRPTGYLGGEIGR